jgi:TonB family protein
MRTLKYSIILVLFVFSSLIDAQTTSGKLKSNETWRGNIFITGDVIVPKKMRLVILPGTNIKFTPKKDDRKSGVDKNLIELVIYGELIAEGTPNSQITFTSAATDKRMGDWYGIIIQNKKSTTSITQAVIEYATDGIVISNSNPKISSSVIQYCYNSGITCRIKARPRIIGNTIFANGWAGVFSHKKGNPVLTKNQINMNDYGVVILKSGKANLGMLKGKGLDKNQGQNSFVGNTSFAVDNHSSGVIYAQNNIWAGPDNLPVKNPNTVIYDNRDNAGMGKVIFKPVWSQGEMIAAVAAETANNNPPNAADAGTGAAVSAAANQDLAGNIPPEKNPVSAQPAPPTPDKKAKPEAKEAAPVQKQPEPKKELATAGTAATAAAAVSAEKKPVPAPPVEKKVEKKKEITVPTKPVQEWQIDQRRRKYVGKRVLPEYPSIAAQAGVSGQVIIQVVVDDKGNVVSTRILKSTTDVFNDVCIEAVKKTKYAPMTMNGVPVKVKLIERYVFNLN